MCTTRHSVWSIYPHAWVQQPAVRLQTTDLALARAEMEWAKTLLLPGGGYAGPMLELRTQGIFRKLWQDPRVAATRLERNEVPAMFWCAVDLGCAKSAGKNDMEPVADLPVAYSLVKMAPALEEGWQQRAIHGLTSRKHASWLLAIADEFHFDDGNTTDIDVSIDGGIFRWPRQ